MPSRASIRLRLVAAVLLVVIISSLSWFLLRHRLTSRKISNVLLISIDTCRADHLSCYGYAQATTPNIDAVAGEGVVFSKVLSPVPLTLPAHSSMLTGTIPPYHGVHFNLDCQLGQSATTLAEILKGHGLATGAVVSAYVMDSQFGLAQGFDTYYDRFGTGLDGTENKERKGGETSRYAMDWLDGHRNVPFFLFLHYFDPHTPYEPPEPFASRFPGNPYAGEIAYTDHCIGQVIGKLKELGLYDSTLIVIAGDHGELLGEHGESSHSYFIYEGAVKVPLIFKLPGQRQPKRIEELVGLIDIVPTICGLLGIGPGSDSQGMDLTGCLRGGQPLEQGRSLYCESLTATTYDASPLLGVVTDRWKYIQTTRPELYDLLRDPGESNNLAAIEGHQAADMLESLKEMLEKQLREGTDSKLELNEESLKRLESLGYVGRGSARDVFKLDKSKDDPKDLVDFYKSDQVLVQLYSEKKYAEASSLCKQMLQQRPAFVNGHKILGRIALQQSDFAGAIPHFRRVLELNPDDIFTHHHMGKALEAAGKLDEAIVHYRVVLSARPNLAEEHSNMGVVLSARGQLDEAISYFRRAIELKPDYPEAYNNLGRALLDHGRPGESIAHFRRALQLKPDFPEAHYNLGTGLRRTGQLSQALDHYREAAGLKPDWPVPLNEMAWILATCPDAGVRDARQAVAYAERASELTQGRSPAILDTLAAAYAAAGDFEKAVKTAQAAMKGASAAEAQKLADAIGKRLQLYRQAEPYREAVPASSSREGP